MGLPVTACEVLIVGAGPAGLAVGACLRRAGVAPTLIERGERVGWSWHGHYERLRLHTVKQHSALPHRPFPAEAPRYPSRAEVAAYLEAYARTHGLSPRLGEAARRVYPAADGWHCETDAGHHRAPDIVIATGQYRTPIVPAWPDQERFRGTICHSGAYRSPEPFRGRRVLVVGMGNTGAEIALDLAEHGARPTLAVRGPVHVVPRDILGIPSQAASIRLRGLPPALRDRVGVALSRLSFGDLERYGLRRPIIGPISQIERLGRVPVIDVGTVAAIKAGRIDVVPGLARFAPEGVVFADGAVRPFDAVVLATGYRADVASFLVGAGPALDQHGYPRRPSGDVAGLHFVGYGAPSTGLLREIALTAPHVAEAVARRRRGAPRGGFADQGRRVSSRGER